ncbi:MAG TPA: GxxExxY protein [Chthoniobacteraceae bacterium]|nr:GxxExxY protein [Chthoniobacteraceae bacterium]
MEREQLEQLATELVDAAMSVHRELGPGLLDSAYEMALCRELSLRSIAFERQKPMSVSYKGALLDCGYRIGLLVEQAIVVELKAVDGLAPIHEAQLFTYLKLAGCHLGFLINFNSRLLKHGLKRIVFRLPEITAEPVVLQSSAASSPLRSFAVIPHESLP